MDKENVIHAHTLEYYSTIKEEILSFMTQTDLEDSQVK